MKKWIAVALSAFMCLSCAACAATEETAQTDKTNEYVEDTSSATAYYMDGSEFTPVLRFVAVGDTHVNDVWMGHTDKRLENLFTDAYAYSRTQEYDKLDAVVVVGDYVEEGYVGEYQQYMATWQKNILPETSFICLQAGHELIAGTKENHKQYTGNDMGTHVEINGYHFIAVSNVRLAEDGSYSETMDEECDVEWVKEALDEAVADTGDMKPIFTFHHHPITDTILGSQSKDPVWNPQVVLAPLFENHANIVDFSAHLHDPIVHPRSIMQHDYTTLAAGAAYYSCQISDVEDRNNHISNAEANATCGGMTIVEVDEAGRIRMLPYNLAMREFYTELGTGNEGEQLIRYIERAGDKSTWLYTDERGKNSDLPTWSEAAAVKNIRYEQTDVYLSTGYTDRQTRTRLILTFDQAEDKDGIECYRLRIIRKSNNQPVKMVWNATAYANDGVKAEKEYFYLNSKYYVTPVPKTVTVQTSGLNPDQFIQGEEYRIELTAIDTWHNESTTKLTYDFVCEKTF